jgi:hypothetical protein
LVATHHNVTAACQLPGHDPSILVAE